MAWWKTAVSGDKIVLLGNEPVWCGKKPFDFNGLLLYKHIYTVNYVRSFTTNNTNNGLGVVLLEFPGYIYNVEAFRPVKPCTKEHRDKVIKSLLAPINQPAFTE